MNGHPRALDPNQRPSICPRNAYTPGNNDGREAGQSIDHLHVIMLPRYKGDVVNPGGGIRNIIPARAQYIRF